MFFNIREANKKLDTSIKEANHKLHASNGLSKRGYRVQALFSYCSSITNLNRFRDSKGGILGHY
jgi:hypothetical protein